MVATHPQSSGSLDASAVSVEPTPQAGGDAVRAVCIQLDSTSARFLVPELVRDFQLDWLANAAKRGGVLVVLLTVDALELYSTASVAARVFRPVMQNLHGLVASEPQLKRARVCTLEGEAAEEHLHLRACGLRGAQAAQLSVCGALHQAAALSAASAALGAVLGPLFWSAASCSRRVTDETNLHTLSAPSASQEVERLAAERIVAEELVSLRLRRTATHLAAAREAGPRPSNSSRPAPFVDEYPSFVRLKAACSLVPDGTTGK